MAIDPDALGQGWLGKTIALVVGAAATAVAGWIAGRKTEKANIVSIAQAAAIGVIDVLTAECKRVGEELVVARLEITEVRADHRRCESRLDLLEQEKRELRATIEGLMQRSGVASYTNEDLDGTRKMPK